MHINWKKYLFDQSEKSSSLEDDIAFDEFIKQCKEEGLVDPILMIDEIDTDKEWENLSERIQKTQSGSPTRVRKVSRYLLPIAAAITLLIISVTYLYWYAPKNQVLVSDLPVLLETAMGSTYNIRLEEGAEFSDNQGNVFASFSDNELKLSSIGVLGEQKLIIPSGKTLKVLFPDGSRVHCASETTLTIPTHFGKSTRSIDLLGSAFFDVAHDKNKSFQVNTKALSVKVLGTKFNVSAYPEETTKAVLVEGSVVAKSNVSDGLAILKPNEMAAIQRNSNSLSLQVVNASYHTAWTSGELIFKDVKFSEIVRSLERHFGVDIVLKNKDLEKESFTAQFHQESIQEILTAFQTQIGFEYAFRNNKIIIK